MIICDEHRLVFVHIPKCAGTSVRNTLQHFDSRGGAFTSRRSNHPSLGQLDFVHIPLFVLREHFRPEFEILKEYWSIAVIRNPYNRFASSVTQHLNMYSAQSIQTRSREDIQTAIKTSIDYLSRQPKAPHLLSSEYIHFQKQVDYIDLDGARVINNLYLVDEIDDLLADVGRRLGENLLEPTHDGGRTSENRTFVYRNDLLRRVLETSRPLAVYLANFLSESVKEDIRSLVYVPRDQRMKSIFQTNQVRDFIQEYYADDIAVYSHLIESKRNDAQ